MRHTRVFAIVGCVIGLLTFILRDILQDTLKQFQDSIAIARQVEEMGEKDDNAMADEVQLNLRWRQLSDRIEAMKNGTVPPGGNLLSEASDTLEVLANAQTRLDRISDMIDQLPGHTEVLKADRDKRKIELFKLKQDVNGTISESLSAHSPNVMYDVLVLLGMVKVFTFDLEILPLQESSVKSAKMIEQRSQRLYEICTEGFWILSLFGWGLALVSAIYGWKDPSQ